MRRAALAVVGVASLVLASLELGATPPAGAIRSSATMRQLAGGIPDPFSISGFVGAMAKSGDSLYVVDLHGILRVDLETNDVSVFAGDPMALGSADGGALNARFEFPSELATDGRSLYVLDRGNYTVRRIDLGTRQVTTLAGSAGNPGYADGTGAAARFAALTGMTLGADGANLYVPDQGTIRKIGVATGVVTTFAGVAGQFGKVDGVGSAARLGGGDITQDADGLWMIDGTCIRKIVESTALVTTLGCLGGANYGSWAITTVDADVFVATSHDDGEAVTTDLARMNKTTAAVSPAPEPPSPYFLSQHLLRDGVRFWVSGNYGGESLFIVDPVTGDVVDPVGFGAAGTADGAGQSARLRTGMGMSTDGTNLYVSDFWNDRVRKVVAATGVTSTLATGIPAAQGSAVVGGELFVASANAVKRVVLATGQVSAFATLGPSSAVANDIASDGTNLYVTSWDCAVYRVAIATGAVSVLAGTPGQCGHVDGVGTAARLGGCCFQWGPKGIAIDGGNLYVADTLNDAIRKIVIASATVSTPVSLTGPGAGGPLDVASDGTNLYVSNRDRLYKVPIASGLPSLLTGTYPSITYRPALASATRPYKYMFENALVVGAAGHHLYFTDGTGVGLVTDAKVPPQLTIGDVTMSEGNGGTAQAVFTVRLSSPQPNLVSVVFLTNDATATTAGGDYVGQSGRLDFAPGVVEQRVKVAVNGDMTDEADESFKVRLVWPSGGATVARNLGTATVLDDDPNGGGATLAIGDVSVVEGDDLSALAVFPVRLSSAQPGSVSVNFGTADGTATVAGGDYEPRLGTLTFAPGITSATIFVKLTGDYRPEALETFSLVLASSSGPTVTRATGTGSIIDDD